MSNLCALTAEWLNDSQRSEDCVQCSMALTRRNVSSVVRIHKHWILRYKDFTLYFVRMTKYEQLWIALNTWTEMVCHTHVGANVAGLWFCDDITQPLSDGVLYRWQRPRQEFEGLGWGWELGRYWTRDLKKITFHCDNNIQASVISGFCRIVTPRL